MSEAEKKWEEWDNEFTSLEGPTPAKCYKYSREAYKSALRREIEKERNELEQIKLSKEVKYADLGVLDGKMKECNLFLKLLETVEP